MFRYIDIITRRVLCFIGLERESVASSHSQRQPLLVIPSSSFPRYLDLPASISVLVSAFLIQSDRHHLNIALAGVYKLYFGRHSAKKTSKAPSSNPLLPFFQCRQFKVLLPESKLLWDVIRANYEAAEKTIDQDASLIFRSFRFTHPDGSSEWTSPLKQAFRNLDTYMWTLFYERIKHNSDWVQTFLQQAEEQVTQVDLSPLIVAYKTYETKRQSPFSVTRKECDQAWLAIGAEQRKLPIHMLKEFLRGSDTWNLYSDFDVKASPPPNDCWIYDRTDKKRRCWISLFVILMNSRWGASFALYRGDGNLCPSQWSAVALQEGPRWGPNNDAAVFCHLWEIRKNNLKDHLALLQKAPAHCPSH